MAVPAMDNPKSCSNFLRVIDNSSRFIHPAMERLIPQHTLQVIFDNITRAEYGPGRPLFSRPISPRFLTGLIPDRKVVAMMSIQTKNNYGDFQRKSDMISVQDEAELVIRFSAIMINSLPQNSRSGHPQISFLKTMQAVSEGRSFVNHLFLENFLSDSDMIRILGASSAYFDSDVLKDQSRLGAWAVSPTSASLTVRLDSLTFAEFSVLINQVADRIDERSKQESRDIY